VTPGEYRVAAAATPATVAAVTAWLADHDLALLDLRAGRASLHDVFVRLTETAAIAAAEADEGAGRPGGRGRGRRGRGARSGRGRS
jgi:hypothetical protein